MSQQTHCSSCRSCLLLAGVLILGGCAGAGRPTPAAGSTKEPAGYRQSTVPIDGRQCATERALIGTAPY